MRYLEEKGIGFDVGVAKVPIVPAAILFDLSVGDRPDVRPGSDCGYRAAAAARRQAVSEGNVGAGAGATVGKSAGSKRAMKGGIGTSSIQLESGLVVGAIIAVNAWGDVIDPQSGKVIAGVRTEDGKGLADARKLFRRGEIRQGDWGRSTTIGIVGTNAKLTKTQAAKVAQMAHDGLARAIEPAHTPVDGDTLFALSTGTWPNDAELTIIGELAAQVTAEAIVRAVEKAEGIPGYPAARDLGQK
jgi:L-aminopeptidase/D-esterase-like protein